ncbi:MAG: DUF1289 domain-containing protein [Pseudomonadota bacterium]|nr:DUF1289 domain-containing protein [Pseudomonadota bacterium]
MRPPKPIRDDRPPRPMSPCINICTMDSELICIGCRRTLKEIEDWSKLTIDQQWKIIEALPAR